MTQSATMRAGLRLGMRAPPLDEKRGNYRKHEVDSGKGPEAAPITRHFPQAGAQLIDAHHAVDREVRRNMVPAAHTGPGIASRGQEKPVRKSCGRLVPRKMSVGVSGCLNQAPTAWPMKLVARTKTDASANNCSGLPSAEKP